MPSIWQEPSWVEIKTLPYYSHGQNRLGLGNLICFGNTCKEGSSRKFNWNMKKNFIVQVVEHCVGLPGDGVEFSSLGIFKSFLDTIFIVKCSRGLTVLDLQGWAK